MAPSLLLLALATLLLAPPPAWAAHRDRHGPHAGRNASGHPGTGQVAPLYLRDFDGQVAPVQIDPPRWLLEQLDTTPKREPGEEGP